MASSVTLTPKFNQFLLSPMSNDTQSQTCNLQGFITPSYQSSLKSNISHITEDRKNIRWQANNLTWSTDWLFSFIARLLSAVSAHCKHSASTGWPTAIANVYDFSNAVNRCRHPDLHRISYKNTITAHTFITSGRRSISSPSSIWTAIIPSPAQTKQPFLKPFARLTWVSWLYPNQCLQENLWKLAIAVDDDLLGLAARGWITTYFVIFFLLGLAARGWITTYFVIFF